MIKGRNKETGARPRHSAHILLTKHPHHVSHGASHPLLARCLPGARACSASHEVQAHEHIHSPLGKKIQQTRDEESKRSLVHGSGTQGYKHVLEKAPAVPLPQSLPQHPVHRAGTMLVLSTITQSSSLLPILVIAVKVNAYLIFCKDF